MHQYLVSYFLAIGLHIIFNHFYKKFNSKKKRQAATPGFTEMFNFQVADYVLIELYNLVKQINEKSSKHSTYFNLIHTAEFFFNLHDWQTNIKTINKCKSHLATIN